MEVESGSPTGSKDSFINPFSFEQCVGCLLITQSSHVFGQSSDLY